MAPRSFRTQAEWRAWLEKNHATTSEITLKLYKVHAKHRGIGYREALDEALCFGWIDGVLHRIDADCHRQRFTPRRARSKWSHVNIRRFRELQKEGRVRPAGLAAFDPGNVAHASYSSRSPKLELDAAFMKRLRASPRAFAFYESEPPGRRRQTVYWVMSAKKPETRERRFAVMLASYAKGRKLGVLEPKSK